MLLNRAAEPAERITKYNFRRGLRGSAEKWYRDLPKEKQAGTWADLKAEFLTKYDNDPSLEEVSVEDYVEEIQAVRQAGKPITQYVRDTERLHEKCPEALQRMLGRQFLAGLDDRTKAREALLFLSGEKRSPFPKTKEAVIRAYDMDDGPGPFDHTEESYNDQLSKRYQSDMSTSLLGLVESLRQRSEHRTPAECRPPYPPNAYGRLPTPGYQSGPPGPAYQSGPPMSAYWDGYTQAYPPPYDPYPTQDYRPRHDDRQDEWRDDRRDEYRGDWREDRQDGRRNDWKDDQRENDKTFYHGIYCHNCTKEGHYSTSLRRLDGG
ncbi:hypothetical protein MMC07_000930 [Pseudocyphellaria aurata]|nr:hypothetical protein [Pseudocyphellaria aurata]